MGISWTPNQIKVLNTIDNLELEANVYEISKVSGISARVIGCILKIFWASRLVDCRVESTTGSNQSIRFFKINEKGKEIAKITKQSGV